MIQGDLLTIMSIFDIKRTHFFMIFNEYGKYFVYLQQNNH